MKGRSLAIGAATLSLVLALVPLAAQDEGKGGEKKGEKQDGLPTPEEIEAENRAKMAERIEKEREAHFRICDRDHNGWVSFREAEFALDLDRTEYQRYDRNGDGRIDWDEFQERYARILSQVGGHPALRPELQAELAANDIFDLTPITRPADAPPTFPAPVDVLTVYDRDGSEDLDAGELDAMFADLAQDLTSTSVLARMDENLTGTLELEELRDLARIVAARFPLEPHARGDELDRRAIYDRLHRTARPRKLLEGSPAMPPLIPGPVSHFRRLDLDDDGFIDEDDLRELLTPARTPIRSRAILAGLDRDGDDRLDEAEFLRCLGSRRALSDR